VKFLSKVFKDFPIVIRSKSGYKQDLDSASSDGADEILIKLHREGERGHVDTDDGSVFYTSMVDESEEVYNRALLVLSEESNALVSRLEEIQENIQESEEGGKRKIEAIEFLKGRYHIPLHLIEDVNWGRSPGLFYIHAAGLTETRNITRERLKFLQDACFVKALTDPHIGAIADAYRDWVIGSGVKFQAIDSKIQDYLEEFWEDNRLRRLLRSIVWEAYVDGEKFIAYYISIDKEKKKTYIDIQTIPASEIVEIETKRNTSRRLAYRRVAWIVGEDGKEQIIDEWIADENYFIQKEKPNREISDHESELSKFVLIQMVKDSTDSQLTGRPILTRVLRWIGYWNEFLKDRLRENHEKSKIFYKIMLKGNLRGAANERERRAPRHGVAIVCTENRDIVPTGLEVHSSDHKEDAMLLLHQCCSGVKMPLHIVDQRTTEGVYAALKTSHTPYSQMIRSGQEFWEPEIETMLRIAIRAGIMSHELEKEVKVPKFERVISEDIEADPSTDPNLIEPSRGIGIGKGIDLYKTVLVTVPAEKCPISVIMPEIVIENMLQLMQGLKIALQRDLMSIATARGKLALDDERESYRIRKQREELEQQRRMGILDPNKTPEGDKDAGAEPSPAYPAKQPGYQKPSEPPSSIKPDKEIS